MLVDCSLDTYTFQQQVKLGICGKHLAHHLDLPKQILHAKLTSQAGSSLLIWGPVMIIANFLLLQCNQGLWE